MNTTQIINSIKGIPFEELSAYHDHLAQQFNDPTINIVVNPDTNKLLPFNAY